MSSVTRKPVFGISDQADTNRTVQIQQVEGKQRRWSAALVFAYTISSFSHDAAQSKSKT